MSSSFDPPWPIAAPSPLPPGPAAGGRELFSPEVWTAAEASPVLAAFIDQELRYRFVNHAFADAFGLDPQAAVGRQVWSLGTPARHRLLRVPMQEALAGGVVSLQAAWDDGAGAERAFEIRLLPRREASGAVDGFHILAVDVTARRVAEATARQASEALSEAQARNASLEAALRQSQKMEAVGRMTGGVAHDFNNMMMGVLGALDLVRARLAAGKLEDLERLLEAASTSAERAGGLTRRLLAFARPQAAGLTAIDVNAALSSLQDLLRLTLPATVNLRMRLAAALPLALADSHQLESAVLNLAINARDAMPAGGLLRVSSRFIDVPVQCPRRGAWAGRYVAVCVSDSGQGMSPEVASRVFEPFFTTKGAERGTGLGLAMVSDFVAGCGGRITLASRPGRGTRIVLHLPAALDLEVLDGAAPGP